MFPWELLSPFIITSQRLATSTLLTGCQRLFLPVKPGDKPLDQPPLPSPHAPIPLLLLDNLPRDNEYQIPDVRTDF